MAAPDEAVEARRAQIVEASIDVFLRFGFKKTSMEDLARAAGLSRQGLYLHFASKEALFVAATEALVGQLRGAYKAALFHSKRDALGRVLGAFEALHGQHIGRGNLDAMTELLSTAERLVGDLTARLEAEFLRDLAGVLEAEGLVKRAQDPKLSARALAEHLDAVSTGLKHRVHDLGSYRDKMRLAMRVVFGL